MDDVFCKIIRREIPADFVMEEEDWIAVRDINPQAPVHILVIPKKHVGHLEDAIDDKNLLSGLMLAVDKVAHKMGIAEAGYRVIVNQKEGGGQTVPHLHIHVLGGKNLGAKIVG